MIQIEQSTHIDRPPTVVFDHLTNVENLSAWQSGILDVRAISDGPVQRGYRFEETVRMGFSKMRLDGEVTEFNPGELFALRLNSKGPIDCEPRFNLAPEAGGTRLTVRGAAQLKGVWRLLRPLIAAELRKQTRSELAALKRLVEIPAPGIAPAVI